MVSLIPGESENRLKQLFGNDYESLSPMEMQTLVTADLEGEVSNSRLQLFRSEHPTELTRMLQGLAGRGFLEQIGQKRGAIYRLPSRVEQQFDQLIFLKQIVGSVSGHAVYFKNTIQSKVASLYPAEFLRGTMQAYLAQYFVGHYNPLWSNRCCGISTAASSR